VQGCPEPIPELIHGKPVIVEKLFNLSFNISPQVSFFFSLYEVMKLYPVF
jgi:hypothetical protein